MLKNFFPNKILSFGDKFYFSLIILLLSVVIVVFVVLKSLEENVVYFFSPTEIYNNENISFNKKIRIGGLVKEGS